MAVRGGSGQQLQMFMTPRQLMTEVGHADAPGFKSREEMARIKWGAAKRSALAGNIAAEGVKEPVGIDYSEGHPLLIDGHHRMVSAYMHDPDNVYVPVQHHQISTHYDAYAENVRERGRAQDPTRPYGTHQQSTWRDRDVPTPRSVPPEA